MRKLYGIFLVLNVFNIVFPAWSQSAISHAIERKDVRFFSNESLINAWLFIPTDSLHDRWPCIVMAPGFSGTKECTYQFYAAHFAKEGFAVLLIDYLNFGESGGKVRGEADPWQQIQCYRDGISFVSSHALIDPSRIGIWGGSYSGGHVLVVSALDRRVKCMVAMTPFISGSYYVSKIPVESQTHLYQLFHSDRLSRSKGEIPVRVPVASNDENQFCAIPGRQAWNFIQSFNEYSSTFENCVTLRSLEMQMEYEPGDYARRIPAIPKLFIVAKADENIPEHLIAKAYNECSEPKKLEYLDGHHFSPYMEKLSEACSLAIGWFKKFL